jgi:hypothetical protein
VPAIREDRGHFCVVGVFLCHSEPAFFAGEETDVGRKQRIARVIKLRFGMTNCSLRVLRSCARLLHHLHENFSGFVGIAHLPQERNARTFHSILGLQAHMKAEPVHGSHRRLL